jgi:pimeloyl-ACP methyl ester carboxylesterase
VPQAFVDDVTGMTFSALRDSASAAHDYRDARPLPERLADNRLPLLVVFGTEDNVADPAKADDYEAVPGARVTMLVGLGHSPHVERPRLIARMISRFDGRGRR